jgi:hypothetical protein
VQEACEPNAFVDLFDFDGVACKDGRDVDFLAVQTDATAGRDQDIAVVERISERQNVNIGGSAAMPAALKPTTMLRPIIRSLDVRTVYRSHRLPNCIDLLQQRLILHRGREAQPLEQGRSALFGRVDQGRQPINVNEIVLAVLSDCGAIMIATPAPRVPVRSPPGRSAVGRHVRFSLNRDRTADLAEGPAIPDSCTAANGRTFHDEKAAAVPIS